MPTQEFVILDPNAQTELYIIGYNTQDPPSSLRGNLELAIIYPTLEAANSAAASIGGGTTGIPKPKK